MKRIPVKLSTNEAVSLTWLSQGKSLEELAAIEGKSVEEAQLCINALLQVLRARSIPAALANAKSIALI